MDKRSQISRLIILTQAQVKSIETNYNNLGNPDKALAALDRSVDYLMQIWQLIKSDENQRFNHLIDILSDEQSFKKDEC